MGKVHSTQRFGFCAYPTGFGSNRKRTYIVNEWSTGYWKYTKGKPVLEWPDDATLKAEWRRNERW